MTAILLACGGSWQCWSYEAPLISMLSFILLPILARHSSLCVPHHVPLFNRVPKWCTVWNTQRATSCQVQVSGIWTGWTAVCCCVLIRMKWPNPYTQSYNKNAVVVEHTLVVVEHTLAAGLLLLLFLMVSFLIWTCSGTPWMAASMDVIHSCMSTSVPSGRERWSGLGYCAFIMDFFRTLTPHLS